MDYRIPTAFILVQLQLPSVNPAEFRKLQGRSGILNNCSYGGTFERRFHPCGVTTMLD